MLIICLIGFISFTTNAQKTNSVASKTKVGTIFTIGKVKYNSYKYIKFPKPNFVIKRGGIYNFKNIIGETVVVTSIKDKEDGAKIITIKLENGSRFFNSHKYLKVDLNNALLEKELVK